jgi:hypothetical protein
MELTNDLTSLIRVWGLLTYQASVLKQLRNVRHKGHVLALTKLGSRGVLCFTGQNMTLSHIHTEATVHICDRKNKSLFCGTLRLSIGCINY